MPAGAPARVLHRSRALAASAPPHPISGVPVLDVIYVTATIALCALVALIARGVEKL